LGSLNSTGYKQRKYSNIACDRTAAWASVWNG